MKLEQIMDRDEAQKYIEEMADKLEINMMDFGVRKKTNDEIKSEGLFLEAVMAGLVFYDEEKLCLAQKLTKQISAGDFTRECLYYKTKFKVKDARKLKTGGLEASMDMIAQVCDVPKAIINELHGLNLEIAMSALDFFLK